MGYHVLMAVAGVIALFGAWLAVQALVRRHDPGMGGEPDVLACRMCGADGSCHCGLKGLAVGGAKARMRDE
jgi:hypothetical protein